MLRWAVNDCPGPVAVRYPRGNAEVDTDRFASDPSMILPIGEGEDVTLLSYGTVSGEMFAAARLLEAQRIGCTTLRLLSVTHFSAVQLAQKIQGSHVFVIEEVCSGSGISGEISLCLSQAGKNCKVHSIDLGSGFVPHGDTKRLYRMSGLDHASIADYVQEVLRNEN